MNKRTIVTLALVALVALVAVPFMFAQNAPGRGHGGRGMMQGMGGPEGMHAFGAFGHLQKLQSELGLSDAQATEIKTIFAGLHAQNAQYRDQLKGNMQAITGTLLKDPNNVAGAQAILDQQTQAERSIKANMLTAASKALNVLTADQRAKLAELIAQRQARRAGHMGR